jgi:hypothetical protein
MKKNLNTYLEKNNTYEPRFASLWQVQSETILKDIATFLSCVLG